MEKKGTPWDAEPARVSESLKNTKQEEPTSWDKGEVNPLYGLGTAKREIVVDGLVFAKTLGGGLEWDWGAEPA